MYLPNHFNALKYNRNSVDREIETYISTVILCYVAQIL